jgi:hypothetical protein
MTRVEKGELSDFLDVRVQLKTDPHPIDVMMTQLPTVKFATYNDFYNILLLSLTKSLLPKSKILASKIPPSHSHVIYFHHHHHHQNTLTMTRQNQKGMHTISVGDDAQGRS